MKTRRMFTLASASMIATGLVTTSWAAAPDVKMITQQLLFIGVVLSLIALLKRLPISAPQGAWRVLPYSIGGLAAYWTIDRVMSFLPVAV